MLRTLFLILFFLGVTTDAVNTRCTRSNLHVTTLPPLYLYQSIDVANVTVYHCLYREENACNKDICFNCSVGRPNYTVRGNEVDEYSDITANCLEAFDSKIFKDRYRFPRNLSPVGESGNVLADGITIPPYDCSNKTSYLSRTINITVNRHKTVADVYRDRITLKSGTVCRYTSGFCHDPKENIDVIWRATKDHLTCDKLKNILVPRVYNFTLNQSRYALIHNEDKYFALELKGQVSICGITMWKTDKKWFLVSENTVDEVYNLENTTLAMADVPGAHFRRKQHLYDFLVDKCNLLDDEDDNEVRVTALLESALKIKYQKESLVGLETEVQRLRYRLEMFFYITVSAVLCLAVVMTVCFVYCKRCKRGNVTEDTTKISSQPKPNNGNVYDYISSEYNINSLYGEK